MRRGRCWPVVLALLLPAVVAAGQDWWVFFAGKGGGRISWQESAEGHSDAELDLPIDSAYLSELRANGLGVRHCSRWLNAVSVSASEEQRRWLRERDFVREIRPVRRFRAAPVEVEASGPPAVKTPILPEYGVSFEQLAQIGVVDLHNLGYDGSGVRIGLIDNGYHYFHETFERLQVVAERDFVNGDDRVTDEAEQPVTGNEIGSSQNIHGAQVLSILAGYQPGRFIGVAPGAAYILAKTEENAVEMPIEEDRWIAGLEWADSLGADVVSTSLGYNLWDDGTGYTPDQLDGKTALTTRAAAIAVRRGVTVVVAAGNEGNNSWIYVTPPADADGVISVGSVDVPQGGLRPPAIAPSSSRGPTADGRIKPDVVAPGQGVIAANIRGGDYMRVSGTSFAAPMVAGVCALLLQVHPDWGPEEIGDALRGTATDLGAAGPDTVYGWGQVDALRASGLEPQVVEGARIGDPFPNPVSGDRVYFPLLLNGREEVELRIFDLAGNLIFAKSGSFLAGRYTRPERALRWEIDQLESLRGERLANGLFLYQLQTSATTRSGKIALVRERP